MNVSVREAAAAAGTRILEGVELQLRESSEELDTELRSRVVLLGEHAARAAILSSAGAESNPELPEIMEALKARWTILEASTSIVVHDAIRKTIQTVLIESATLALRVLL